MRKEPPDDGDIHGARGWAAAVGSTNGTPPSGSAIAATHAAASATIGSSSASTPASTSRAVNVEAGWLAGSRMSGSSA